LKQKKLLPENDPHIESNIALLKSRLGLYDEALPLFKETLKFYKKNVFHTGVLSSYYALGDTFRLMKEMDSSLYYNQLGYKYAKDINDLEYQEFFNLNIGATLSDLNKIQESQQHLITALPMLKKVNDKPNIALCHFLLGRNYKSLKETNKSIYHLKQMDSIFLEIHDLHPELRQGYEILVNHYKQKTDLKNQLLYINRLLSLDSILRNNNSYLDRKLDREYDNPKLLSEAKRINQEIKRSRNKLIYLLLLFAFAFIVVLILYVNRQRKHRRDKERFNELFAIHKESQSIYNKSINTLTPKSIPLKQDVVEMILEKLELFEKNRGFLNSNLKLVHLAEQVDSNAKYVAMVIKHKKGMTYTSYINNLRIDYAITQLTNNQNFLHNYTINGIAKEVGFNYTEPFRKAFYKKTGIKPSFYIKKLKETYSNS
jgi:AraC-like DNA-binding protein